MEAFLTLSQSITQSKDFDPKNVGVWETFFLPPEKEVDPKSVVKERLSSFLTKAFRRPVDEELLNRYVGYVHKQLDLEVDFTEAMKAVAAATIASPKFIYLHDQSGKSAEAESLDDFELASRLSFFLWGSIPDQELLDVAEAGNLEVIGGFGSAIQPDAERQKVEAFFATVFLPSGCSWNVLFRRCLIRIIFLNFIFQNTKRACT